jgi:hypothetical protein
LSLVAETTNDIDLTTEETALFTIQFKGKCQKCGKGQKATDYKARRDQQQMLETQMICSYRKKPWYYKAN